MKAKTTDEIIKGLWSAPVFTCPHCRTDEIEDHEEEMEWVCLICHKSFKKPRVIYNEGKEFNPNKLWFEGEGLLKRLERDSYSYQYSDEENGEELLRDVFCIDANKWYKLISELTKANKGDTKDES